MTSPMGLTPPVQKSNTRHDSDLRLPMSQICNTLYSQHVSTIHFRHLLDLTNQHFQRGTCSKILCAFLVYSFQSGLHVKPKVVSYISVPLIE